MFNSDLDLFGFSSSYRDFNVITRDIGEVETGLTKVGLYFFQLISNDQCSNILVISNTTKDYKIKQLWELNNARRACNLSGLFYA